MATLLDLYEPRLLRYAADIVGPTLAKDVVQDTFLRLCQAERAEIEDHVSAWLFTVCRRRALEVRRKVKPLQPLLHDLDDHVHTGPIEKLAREQHLLRLKRCLDLLPDRERELLRLRFDGELSYRDIAQVMGLSVSNVGFILHGATKRLRTLMSDDVECAVPAQGRRA